MAKAYILHFTFTLAQLISKYSYILHRLNTRLFFSMIDKKINFLIPKYTFQNETRATIPYLSVLLLCCDDSKIILHVDSSSEFTQTTFKTSCTNV